MCGTAGPEQASEKWSTVITLPEIKAAMGIGWTAVCTSGHALTPLRVFRNPRERAGPLRLPRVSCGGCARTSTPAGGRHRPCRPGRKSQPVAMPLRRAFKQSVGATPHISGCNGTRKSTGALTETECHWPRSRWQQLLDQSHSRVASASILTRRQARSGVPGDRGLSVITLVVAFASQHSQGFQAQAVTEFSLTHAGWHYAALCLPEPWQMSVQDARAEMRPQRKRGSCG